MNWEQWTERGWRTHLPAVPDIAGLVSSWASATLPSLAQESARSYPDRVAVQVDSESITHGSLDGASGRVAGWLSGRLAAGDRVLLGGPSSVDFVVAYLGILRAGGVVVLANPAYTAAELEHLISDSGARLAFASPEVADRLAGLNRPPEVALLSAHGLHNRDPIVQPPAPATPDSVALLAYTSGTTGKPKGVPLTHRHLVTSIRAAMAAWEFGADDVLVHALPLFHQHGLGGVHATLIAGSTAVLLSRFAPEALVETVANARASVLFAVPTMYERLCDAADTTALRRLRLCVCGSAPLSPALAGRTAEMLGKLPLVRYGTTESGLDISNPLTDPHPDTIGLPLPGVSMRLVDDEIQLRGPQVFDGYWQDTAATAEAFTADGWFRTGDLGRLDEKTGHLVIAGRIKELIITGGLNVYPREVELALEEHPAVAEAAVTGVPDERWGEQVTGWVVPRPGAAFDEPELIAHVRSRLTAYKCPKRIFRLKGLPRNHMGKISRGALTPALAALQRAEEIAALGAFVELSPDAADQPGIPVAVKDLIDVAGQTVRNGTPGLGHRTATEDSEVWARMRAAGHVAMGRTSVPDLMWSVLTPGCRNPWDPARTPGGSSGGSAVAVATGVVPVALGSDTGGSIRIPAALCGVAGLRPTFGTVSARGTTALTPSMDTIGPIALTAAECLRVHEILAGPGKPAPSTVDGLLIGWPVTLWEKNVDPEVRRLVESAADALRAAGARIVDVEMPLSRRYARGAGYTTMLAESARLWWAQCEQAPESLGPVATDLLRVGAALSTMDYETARSQAEMVRAEVDGVLAEVSALLLPTVPLPAVGSPTVTLGGREEAVETAYFRLTALASVTGHPALTVPAGLSGEGLPVGAQIVGRRRQEALICLLGGVIEDSPESRALAVARRRLFSATDFGEPPA